MEFSRTKYYVCELLSAQSTHSVAFYLFQYVRSKKEKTGVLLDPALISVSEPSSDWLL